MDRALEKGFDKFSEIGQKFYSVLKAGMLMRDNLNIIMTCHSENIGKNEPMYKIKTIGRMLDEKITIEGLFTYVLFTSIQRDADDKPVYMFQTHSDGTNTCKTPMGCFEEDYIPNDLQFVIDKIAEYDA